MASNHTQFLDLGCGLYESKTKINMDDSSCLAYFQTPWTSILLLMLLIVVPLLYFIGLQHRTNICRSNDHHKSDSQQDQRIKARDDSGNGNDCSSEIKRVGRKSRQMTVEVNYNATGGTRGQSGGEDVTRPLQCHQLTSNNIHEILNSVWEARQKWYNIGIELKLEVSDLDVIQCKNNENPDNCITEMLVSWLRRGGATWEAMIDALNQNAVGFCELADRITAAVAVETVNDTSEVIYGSDKSQKPEFECPKCGECSLERFLEGDCPKYKSFCDSAFPYLDVNAEDLTDNEMVTLQVKLRKETGTIIREFSNLVLHMRKFFKDRKIDPQDMVTSALGVATRESSTCSLLDSLSIKEVYSVDWLVSHLLQNGYISFFNYHIVEYLISSYGTSEDQHMFHMYVTKFKIFCKRNIFEIPTYVFGSVPSDSEKLAFKITEEMLNNLQFGSSSLKAENFPPSLPSLRMSSKTLRLSLKNALTIQKKVAEALGLKNVGCLVFLSVSKGCIELTFSIPKIIMGTIKRQFNSSHTEVTSLETSGICILCGPPSKPFATEVTNDSIILEWSKPEYHGLHPVKCYYVHYRSVYDEPGMWRTLQTKHPDESFEINLPHNRRSFLFNIQAVTDIGAGIRSENSDPIELKCIEEHCFVDEISSKPGKPRATMVMHDCIQLEWTKPEQGLNNITSYTVLYRSLNDPPNQWIEQKAITTKEMVTVSQLLERTIYSFKVQPECEDGIGLESDSSEPITTQMLIPSKPGKPIATNVAYDSILLEWTKPEQGAHNTISYTVLYRSISDPPDQWIQYKVKSTVKKLTVSELSECTFYCFKIRPECEAGIGLESDKSDPIQTKLMIPSKPGKPKVSSVTHDSVQLEWTKPQQGAHNVTSYTVFYRSTSDPPDKWIKQEVKSGKEIMTVSQLLERTIYFFNVRPESEDGFGLVSDISEPIITNMMLPSKPRKPIATNVTHDSIQLEWTKPEQGAHNIISYTIFYRLTSDPPDQWIQHIAKSTMEKLTVSELSEYTFYRFKIRPDCEVGVGLESDMSDPIQTKMIIPSKPGKPKASRVTHNSIQLEWTKPEEGAHNVTSYVIFYHSASDSSDQWIQLKTETAEEKVTVSHLSETTNYSFKIQPEYKGGVGTESDLSEHIKTEGVPFSMAVQKLWDARRKWYYIGLCLGVSKTDLDIIESNYRQDTDSCFRKMLTLWLKQVSGTWQMLIDALHDKTVGYHSLADSIEAEFLSHASIPSCGRIVQSGMGFKCPDCGTSLEKHLNRECPILLSLSDSAFPFLDTSELTEDEKLKLHVKLSKDASNINNEFRDLVYRISESFEEMPSKVLQKVAKFVQIRLSISTPSLEGNPASEIIQCLNKNMSFFNYNNIKLVIDEFGTEADKEKLSAYEASFKKFCKRSVFEVPEVVFGSPPDHGQMLIFKVTDQVIESLPPNTCDRGLPGGYYHHTVTKSANTLQISLNDALKIQMKIAEVLHIENVGCMIFLGASKGCIELKFSVPNAILDKVKEQYDVKTLTELPGFADLDAAKIHILCGSPGKPIAITATSDGINLQWSKLEYQGSYPIQHYCVHYRSLKDSSAKWRTVQSKALVENLESGKLPQNKAPFVFKVQAVNKIGAGVPSKNSDPIDLLGPPLEISGDFPSKAGKPKALSVTHDSVQLEWSKPERGVESITSYTILYRAQFNDPPNQWIEKRSVSAEERVVVSQLLENTTYFFQVQPECEAGVGLESDISDPIMTEIIFPSKPGKPRALKVTHDSIKLEWTKPEQGAHNVTSYSVFCHSSSDPADYWTEYKHITTEESVLISQLREDTPYYFKIQPQCADKDGLQSDVSDPISTEMIIPSQPGKPKCVGATHDSIQIEWTKPELGAHNITSYTIFYRSTSDPPDIWMQQTVKPTDKKLTVLELSQSTIYLFKVRPECSDNFGSESDTSEPIKTKMRIPSKPTASILYDDTKDTLAKEREERVDKISKLERQLEEKGRIIDKSKQRCEELISLMEKSGLSLMLNETLQKVESLPISGSEGSSPQRSMSEPNVEQLKKEMKNATDQISDLHAQLEEANLRTAIADCQLEAIKSKHAQQIGEYESMLKMKNQEILFYQGQNQKYEQKIDDLNEEVTDLKEEVRFTEGEYRHLLKLISEGKHSSSAGGISSSQLTKISTRSGGAPSLFSLETPLGPDDVIVKKHAGTSQQLLKIRNPSIPTPLITRGSQKQPSTNLDLQTTSPQQPGRASPAPHSVQQSQLIKAKTQQQLQTPATPLAPNQSNYAALPQHQPYTHPMGQSVTVPSSGSTRYMTSGSSQMIVCAGNVSMGQQPRMQQDQSGMHDHPQTMPIRSSSPTLGSIQHTLPTGVWVPYTTCTTNHSYPNIGGWSSAVAGMGMPYSEVPPTRYGGMSGSGINHGGGHVLQRQMPYTSGQGQVFGGMSSDTHTSHTYSASLQLPHQFQQQSNSMADSTSSEFGSGGMRPTSSGSYDPSGGYPGGQGEEFGDSMGSPLEDSTDNN